MAHRAVDASQTWDERRAFRWCIITPLWFDFGFYPLVILGPRISEPLYPVAFGLGIIWAIFLVIFSRIALNALYGEP